MKKLGSLALPFLMFLSACQSPSSKKPDEALKPEPSSRPPKKAVALSLPALQQKLGLYAARDELGVKEKIFNSCDFPGNPSPLDCRTQYLSLIHFQMLCRASTGTVEAVYNWELKPVTSASISWMVGSLKGSTQTDGQGFGQILLASSSSSKNQKLNLKIKNQALQLSLSETKKIVVPQDWCE